MRNALISNFNSLALRSDTGVLWENYLVSERIKLNHYTFNYAGLYFWRTTQQQEIDYIEERDGKLYCYEFKRNPKKRAALSVTFAKNYPGTAYFLINPDNYQDFIGKVRF